MVDPLAGQFVSHLIDAAASKAPGPIKVNLRDGQRIAIQGKPFVRSGVTRLFDNTRFTDHPSWTYNESMATTPSGSRITVEPGKCGGRPCIRHMRIRVKDVLEMLASGASEDQILADYPDLEREDIRACLEYAAQYFDHPVFLGG